MKKPIKTYNLIKKAVITKTNRKHLDSLRPINIESQDPFYQDQLAKARERFAKRGIKF